MDPEDLRRRLDAVAAEDLEEALTAARAGARERVRAVLEDALVERMLRSAEAPPPRAAAEAPLPRAAEEKAPGEKAPGEAVYLYAVLHAEDAASLPSIPGLGGAVETVVAGDLAAVVSRVPLAEFGDEHLKANLERMDWLERTARTHEDVVAAVRARATLVPMRLCTVFHTAGAVHEMLEGEGPVLTDALARLRGRTEWSVKVLADPDRDRVQQALAADPAAADEEAGAEGRGYLAARRRERDAADTADARLRVAVRDVHESLAAVAESALRNPVQRRELSGYEGEMLLNGVYLVDDARSEDFFARVDELAERHAGLGLELERTGPWPPYNFVAPPDAP